MAELRDKFLGCIAATWVGSAMGAAVEGWSREKIRQQHGYVEKLLTYKHYSAVVDWQRPPGTTEDGIERQKLITTAILEQQGRVKAHDVVKVWLRDLEPEKMKYKQESFDRSLLLMARAGVPPVELGRLWPFPNLNSVARASHPLGLINAGDPEAAADDTLEVGKLYVTETAFALRWAMLYNAAIAEACRPGATVQSVLDTARRFASYRAEAGSLYAAYDTVEKDLARALDLAARHTDPMALRDEFYEYYDGGRHVIYSQSQANEVVPKGFAIFAVTGGDPRRAITSAVNFGRDTDCVAAVAGGLAGTLNGAAGIPREWIDQVNEATRGDPYTNNRRTIEEAAEGLLGAFHAKQRRLAQYVRTMGEGAAS